MLLYNNAKKLQTRKKLIILDIKVSHRKHSRSILKGIGQSWHASVVRETGVAVAWRQRRIQEGLLCGVMRLALILLCLS